MKGTFGEGSDAVTIYKLIFKNSIGKILYDGSISGKLSKFKKVEEKSSKNQYKIAVVYQDKETKKNQVQYCCINFNRNDDLEEFGKKFKESVEALKAQNGNN